MITVKYNPKKYEVSISGHADSAEKGHDLICSAVSTLFYTLYEVLVENTDMIDGPIKATMKDGNGKEKILRRLQLNRIRW